MIPYRGFESLSLRQKNQRPLYGAFCFSRRVWLRMRALFDQLRSNWRRSAAGASQSLQQRSCELAGSTRSGRLNPSREATIPPSPPTSQAFVESPSRDLRMPFPFRGYTTEGVLVGPPRGHQVAFRRQVGAMRDCVVRVRYPARPQCASCIEPKLWIRSQRYTCRTLC